MSDNEIQEAQPSTSAVAATQNCIRDRSKPTFEYRTVTIDER